jgi:hypothetical protein
LYAGMLMEPQSASGEMRCKLINVNSHSLGVVGIHAETQQKTNVILIPKNTPLPCRAMRVFRTARSDQRSVKVGVVEGESERPEACIVLGECIVRGLPPGLPQNTAVEVEYAYHANGRISVSARIPSVRYSQYVEIQREIGRDLGDIDVWRARLCGHATASDGHASAVLAGSEGRSIVTKCLDALYVDVGKLAVPLKLPETLARSQQAARAAANDLLRAQAKFQEAELAKMASNDDGDLIRLDARLAQAKTELQQVKVRCDFAHLVLGRDCVNAGIEPPNAQEHLAEIHKLRQKMSD